MATADMDAVASVAAAGVVDISQMVMVMGTSVCDILLGDHLRSVEGMCGTVRDAVVPGLWAYETGQASVGDVFNWFTRSAVPGPYTDSARAQGESVYAHLERLAASLEPGANGLLALEWWNGNRSVLVDADLTGLIVGLTLATKPEEIYRALLESTAFGKRVIIEAFETAGLPVEQLVACGGCPLGARFSCRSTRMLPVGRLKSSKVPRSRLSAPPSRLRSQPVQKPGVGHRCRRRRKRWPARRRPPTCPTSGLRRLTKTFTRTTWVYTITLAEGRAA